MDSYNEDAHLYERRWAGYLQHSHDRFLNFIDFSGAARMLDLSCGTGLLAGKILARKQPFDLLILNDPAEEMLDIARSRFSAYPGIRFSSASAHELPFADNSFTHIFSLNAFHNYRHQERVITELQRILRQEGHFYLQDWNRSGFFRPVNTLIRWSVSEHIDTRSTDECVQLLKNHSFRIEQKKSWRYRYWKFFHIQARLTADS